MGWASEYITCPSDKTEPKEKPVMIQHNIGWTRHEVTVSVRDTCSEGSMTSQQLVVTTSLKRPHLPLGKSTPPLLPRCVHLDSLAIRQSRSPYGDSLTSREIVPPRR